jgi:ERCC4-type nuclease
MARRHQLRVDVAERNPTLLDLVRQSDDFELHPEQLEVGDYVIDGGVGRRTKTCADFATSLVDGRLIPQAAALARSPSWPVVLLKGPKPPQMPNVHPNALKGAIAPFAVTWRLPIVHARDPEHACRILRFLARQLARTEPGIHQRYDRKPKRFASRKLYVVRGAGRRAGTGESVAASLRSVARVVTAGRTCCDRFLVKSAEEGPTEANARFLNSQEPFRRRRHFADTTFATYHEGR